MYKYTGDSIISASLTVQVPKPLDNRTVVNNIYELYSIPPAYAYVGMTVANIDNGNIYMLVDKSKINEKAGWRASYESIQIITCTEAEYKEWRDNTDNLFQPIDESKSYLHQDTYYYIYEDSLSAESELQEYVKRSDWMEVLATLSTKAPVAGLTRTNEILQNVINTYATLEHVENTYAPLTMFNLENSDSFIRSNFFTKNEALDKFVKFTDLTGDDIGEGDFIFVTAAQYQTDQTALETYKQGVAAELAQCLKVGDDGELDSITVAKIKSKRANDQQLEVDVTPQGLSINGDPIAKISDIPPHVTLTKAEYDALVENDEIDENTYYHITGDDETYVLQSELVNYYTIPGVQSYIAGTTYTKAQVDALIAALTFDTPEEIAQNYVSKNQLETTLEDYVTIAMLGGEGDVEGEFIFVKQSEFNTYKDTQTAQRTSDLQNIETNYLQKDTDIPVTSVITTLITDGTNQLSIGDVLTFKGDEIALKKDVPVMVTLTKSAYQTLVTNEEVNPDVYYYITDDSDTYVLASQLSDYYTKAGIESYIAGKNYTKAEVDNLIGALSFYTQEQSDAKYVTNQALATTLEDYVTIAMLGGDDMEGQFIFVKASDYADDQEAAAQQRVSDLANIADTYVEKNSDATLNSLETSTIKSGANTVSISNTVKLNDEDLAFSKDVPVIRVISQEAYEELQEKDPNIYYLIYGTDENLAFVTAQELQSYYTRSQTDVLLTELRNRCDALEARIYALENPE